MGSSSRASAGGIARGTAFLIVSQALVSAGQFFFGALTGRVFEPADFGGFVAALSLQGVLIVATTAGIPSFALRTEDLSRRSVARLRLAALVGGIISAAVYLLLAPFWLGLLNAELGVVQIPLLALGQLLSPSAALELSLLRRTRGSKWDALVLASSYGAAMAIAVPAVLIIQDPWTLSIAVPAQAFVQILFSVVLRPGGDDSTDWIRWPDLFRHTGAVSASGIVASVSGQSPLWFTGVAFGDSTLGQLSRATTLTSLPINSLAGAIIRGLAPHWRRVATRSDAAVEREAASIASAMIFLPCAIVAALSSDIVALWLGPGWGQTAALATVLSPAAALGGVFLILISASELRGMFRPVRQSQLAALVTLLAGLALSSFGHEAIWVAAAVCLSQLVGLVVVSMSLARALGARPLLIVKTIANQVLVNIAVGLLIAGGRNLLPLFWPEVNALSGALIGAALAAIFLVLSAPWNSAVRALDGRKFFPSAVRAVLRLR